MLKGKRLARYRRRLGMPGRLRFAAAELLTEEIGEYVDPTSIDPVRGFYLKEDVYRWEVYPFPVPGTPFQLIYGCWQTLTEFVKLGKKNGIAIDHKQQEIFAKEDFEK
jgi:hypothetical protein